MAPGRKNKTKQSQSQEASQKSRANSKLAGSESNEQQQAAEVQVRLALRVALSMGKVWCQKLPCLHIDWSFADQRRLRISAPDGRGAIHPGFLGCAN